MKVFRTIKRAIILTVAAAVIYTPFGVANERYEVYTEKLAQLQTVENASADELETMFIDISEARSDAQEMRYFLSDEQRERLGVADDCNIIEDITEVIAEIAPESELLSVLKR